MYLMLRIVLGIAVFCVCASAVCSWMITRYGTFTAFDIDPGACGCAFTRFSVDGARGARLSGWVVSAPGSRAVLIASHGIADSKNGILPFVIPFVTAGYTVVLYDLRHHNESTGKHCTLGYWETEDLLRVTDYVVANVAGGRPVCYWGFSLGATVALLAAARRADIAAVIAQSPFTSMREVVGYYLWHFYHLPAALVVPLALRISAWRSGMRAEEVDVLAAAPALRRVPVLLIGSPTDRQVPLRWLQRIQAALGANCELLIGPYGHDGMAQAQSSPAHGVLTDTEHALVFLNKIVGA